MAAENYEFQEKIIDNHKIIDEIATISNNDKYLSTWTN